MTTTTIVQELGIGAVAKALNIEGGFPQQDLVKVNAKAHWVNLVVALDCPLQTASNGAKHPDFETVLKRVADSKYPLLENAIPEINEYQLLTTYVTIIKYYVEHGHKFAELNKTDQLRICVHVHQDVKFGTPWCKLIEMYVGEFRDVLITYKTDHDSYIHTPGRDWADAPNPPHILISLSQCAGLTANHDMQPGSLFVPTAFIPFDIERGIIHGTKTYLVPNRLATDWKYIVTSHRNQHEVIVNHINASYRSANRDKLHGCDRARSLALDDVNTSSPVLQVDKIWLPRDRPLTLV